MFLRGHKCSYGVIVFLRDYIVLCASLVWTRMSRVGRIHGSRGRPRPLYTHTLFATTWLRHSCRELTSNQPCLSKLLQTSWNWFWHAGQRSNMVTHVLNTHSDWLISLFADHPSCYTDHRHWFKLVQTASYYILRHACLIWHDAWDKVNKTTWPFSCSCWCLSVLCKTSHTSNALSIFCCLHVMCNTSITRCAVKWKYS